MPRWILYVLLVLVAASLVPMGLVYRSSQAGKDGPRIQIVYDMDQQVKSKTQATNPFFPDGRAMRRHPEGTVARGMLEDGDAYYRGTTGVDTVFVDVMPVDVTPELMARGRERYAIHCAPCHGLAGDGDGLVHRRAQSLAEGTWTPPTDLASQTVVERPVGHLYNTIRNGIRSMPAYGPQIDVEDRWAIVAYVRAIQLSRNASVGDVPQDERAKLP
jgi:mono/diheme cytochrome c family protein